MEEFLASRLKEDEISPAKMTADEDEIEKEALESQKEPLCIHCRHHHLCLYLGVNADPSAGPSY